MKKMAELSNRYVSPSVRLRELIRHLAQTTGKKVVLLVDEYDKPILNVLGDKILVSSRREHLSGIYSVIEQTESELDDVFSRELKGLDREEIREWYNGYSW